MAQNKTQQDLVDQANTRYQIAKQYWHPFFAKAAEELNFITGDQWRLDLRQQRESDGRPVVQLPRIQNFIRQLLSQNRQSQPHLLVSANDTNSKENADLVNGLIRRVEAKSAADQAYDYASELAVKTGFGVLRAYTDYAHDYSFDQEVYIESIYDPSTVTFDPACKDPLFQDAEYVFIESTLTKDDYARQIGESTSVISLAKLKGFSHASPMAVDDEHIVIAEYYRKVYKKAKVYKYANIMTGESRVTNNEIDDVQWVLVAERDSTKCHIEHSLFDGLEFHNTTTIPGSIIPVVPVLGEQVFINQKRHLKGVIRDSMDAQRIVNYAASVQLEVVDLAPKVPWLVEESSIDGYENEWRDANSRNYSYLVYKGKNGVQAPQRMPISTDISSIATIKSTAQDDLQNIFGIFNASLGSDSPEQSGVAIQTRVNQSNQSTYIYKDNLYRSIKQMGRVISNFIPEFYNDRTITIVQADGSDKEVVVQIDPTSSWEISIKEGPTNESQRQSLNADLMKLMSALPAAAPLLADYIVSNSDIPGTDKLVARLQTLLPPEIRQVEANGKDMTAEELKSQLMQNMQNMQQLNSHAQDMELKNQQLMQQLEALKADKTLEKQKLDQEYEIESKKLQFEVTKLNLDFELDSETQRLQKEKLALEAAGIQSDQVAPVSI